MRHHQSGIEWFFDKVFFKLFIVILAFALIFIIAQFALIGYVGYNVITNPEGAANYIGTIAGEVVAPVADAIRQGQ